MRISLLLTTLLATSLISFAQNEDIIHDRNAETRNVKGFHAIRVSHGIDLYLSQASDEVVAVSASDIDYRNRIITEVVNGVLKIYIENEGLHWNWGNKKLKAYVSFKALDLLRASGGSDVYMKGVIKGDKLDIGLSGGSDMKRARVDVRDLTLDQSGGSDVEIAGHAGTLTVELREGSDLQGYELETTVCNIVASGGSDAYVTVSKELSAKASGGSDISYKGSGVIRDLKSSGSSSINKKG